MLLVLRQSLRLAVQVVVHNLPWLCTWQLLKDHFAGAPGLERADVIIDDTGRSRYTASNSVLVSPNDIEKPSSGLIQASFLGCLLLCTLHQTDSQMRASKSQHGSIDLAPAAFPSV